VTIPGKNLNVDGNKGDIQGIRNGGDFSEARFTLVSIEDIAARSLVSKSDGSFLDGLDTGMLQAIFEILFELIFEALFEGLAFLLRRVKEP